MVGKTRGGDARVVFNVRLRPGALAALRREADERGVAVSEHWRELAADGRACRAGQCAAGEKWQGKAVAYLDELTVLRREVEAARAHRCPVLITGAGDALNELFGEPEPPPIPVGEGSQCPDDPWATA